MKVNFQLCLFCICAALALVCEEVNSEKAKGSHFVEVIQRLREQVKEEVKIQDRGTTKNRTAPFNANPILLRPYT